LHPNSSVTVLRRFRDAGQTTLRNHDLNNRKAAASLCSVNCMHGDKTDAERGWLQTTKALVEGPATQKYESSDLRDKHQ
jgi:hypothetical protein